MELKKSSTQVSFSLDIFRILGFYSEKHLLAGLKYAASEKRFTKINRQVEKMSEIVYFIMVKISVPAILGPKAIHSYYTHFSTDLGADAFESPLPMW